MSAGYRGTADWSGISEGVPPHQCGYIGPIDWSGISCGAFTSPIPPTPPHSPMQYEGGAGDMRRVRELAARRRKQLELAAYNEQALLAILLAEW